MTPASSFANIIPGLIRPLRVEDVIKIVFEHFNISVMNSKCRDRKKVLARHFVYYYIKKEICPYEKVRLNDMGLLFRQNHSTVLWGIKTIGILIYSDNVTRRHYLALNEMIRQHKEIIQPLVKQEETENVKKI